MLLKPESRNGLKLIIIIIKNSLFCVPTVGQ